MKQILIDIIPYAVSPLILVESKMGNGRMRLKGKLQEAEVNNGNGRVYPRETLLREVDKYVQGPIKQGNALGELDHPDSQVINLANVSHNIKEIWWQGNEVWGLLEILNTPSGKIVQELVNAGVMPGISSRGLGSVKQIGENVEVQDDFDLLCWDLVSTPSTPGAYMRLSEGKINLENKYSKINSIITDIICSQTGICECNFK